jgi:hypothetical protein
MTKQKMEIPEDKERNFPEIFCFVFSYSGRANDCLALKPSVGCKPRARLAREKPTQPRPAVNGEFQRRIPTAGRAKGCVCFSSCTRQPTFLSYGRLSGGEYRKRRQEIPTNRQAVGNGREVPAVGGFLSLLGLAWRGLTKI